MCIVVPMVYDTMVLQVELDLALCTVCNIPVSGTLSLQI